MDKDIKISYHTFCSICFSKEQLKYINVNYCTDGAVENYAEMFYRCFNVELFNSEREDRTYKICLKCITNIKESFSFKNKVVSTFEKLKQIEKNLQKSKCVASSPIKCVVKKYTVQLKTENTFTEDTVENCYIEEDTKDEMKYETVEIPSPSPMSDDSTDEYLPPSKSKRKFKDFSTPNEKCSVTKKKSSIDQKRPKRTRREFGNGLIWRMLEDNFAKQNKYSSKSVSRPQSWKIYMKQKANSKSTGDEEDAKLKTTQDKGVTEKGKKKRSLYVANSSTCEAEDLGNSQENDIAIEGDASDSEWSTKTEEMKIATGYKRELEMSKKQNFSVPELNPRATECPICKKDFFMPYDLYRHYRKHFPKYLCHICGRGYTSYSTFRSHKTEAHSKDVYECSLCNKTYTMKAALREHIHTFHYHLKKFQCYYCPVKFASNISRRKHMYENHDFQCKTFPCPQCGNIYFTESRRRVHINAIHLKLKNFPCTLCDGRFVSASRLKMHMVKHSGIRNFQCDQCDKAFTTNSHLKRHVKLHNDVKSYQCEYCDKGYVQRSNLKWHIEHHHTE